ncbi:MAG: DinB family protein [Anaerolineales bacterium]|nr:DinB family protein [Anaerolineales bacterium]
MPDQNAAIMVLRGQLKAAHDVLENTMQDVTPEMASWQPPGVANAIGPNYAHVVVAEDALLNGMGRGAPPLLATSWAGKDRCE